MTLSSQAPASLDNDLGVRRQDKTSKLALEHLDWSTVKAAAERIEQQPAAVCS
jgi:hypothetical protein